MNTKISVIIPVYNGEAQLNRCLDSVLRPVSYTHLDVYKRQGYGRSRAYVYDNARH